MHTNRQNLAVEIVWIVLGISAGAFGLKSFLLPNNFIDGGATGIALLIAETTVLDLSYVLLLINIPFVVLGYMQMSKMFVIKSSIAMVALSLILAFGEFPIITDDRLLAAVFGGFFLGAGIGLSVRGGCVIDGTEILALYLSRKFGLSIGDIIMVLNVLVFGVALWLLGVESALYSMLAYFFASKTMDFIIQGIEEYLGVTIVSQHHVKIRERIIADMNTGVTILSGKGGYGTTDLQEKNLDILYSVITRLDLLKIRKIISEIDQNAFVVIQGVRDVRGGLLKKRPVPH
ncbi:MAG: YitT family protein [Cyclobacteriaceae bacterium]